MKDVLFQEEKLSEIIEEIKPLLYEHWQEIGIFDRDKHPLDPDWDLYFKAECAGIHFCLTARQDGKLIGYYSSFLLPKHFHYRSIYASDCDLFFLVPEYRTGLIGLNMLREAENVLKRKGVNMITHTVKVSFPLEPIMKRLGFKAMDIKYFKEV